MVVLIFIDMRDALTEYEQIIYLILSCHIQNSYWYISIGNYHLQQLKYLGEKAYHLLA